MPIYRTNDPSSRWTGKGSNLTPAEVDGNIYELRRAIDAIIASPPTAVNPVSITQSNDKTQFTFNMSDGETLGPIDLPILEFRWRDQWEPDTLYEVLDIFQVVGVGLYAVTVNHTSASTFNKTATTGSPPASVYKEMFEFAPLQNVAYDMAYYYPGVLKDIPGTINRIVETPIARKILLPAAPAAGTYHRARLRTPASTNAQDFILYQNDTNIGTVHFAIGSQAGTVTINSDVTMVANVDTFGVGRQAVDDAVAAGFSVIIAAEQIFG